MPNKKANKKQFAFLFDLPLVVSLRITEKIVIPKFLHIHGKNIDFKKNIGITKCLRYLKPASLRNVSSSVSSQIGFSSGMAISEIALSIAFRFISVSAYA